MLSKIHIKLFSGSITVLGLFNIHHTYLEWLHGKKLFSKPHSSSEENKTDGT